MGGSYGGDVRHDRLVFSVEERERVRDHVLELAGADRRVVAGAVVGALAHGEGDRWSDLDLTFGIGDGVPVDEVLTDWTRRFADDLDAVRLLVQAALRERSRAGRRSGVFAARSLRPRSAPRRARSFLHRARSLVAG
jgi:hypothetical protein